MTEGQTVTDVAILDWIKKFNAAKGWDTLSVPKPEMLGIKHPGGKLKSSPKSLFAANRDDLGNREDIQKQLDTVKSEVSELKRKLGENLTAAEIETLQEQLLIKLDEQQEQEAELALFDRFDRLTKQVIAAEESIPQDLLAVETSIMDLRDKVEKTPADLSKLDPAELSRLRDFHDMVSGNVERARQEVIPLVQSTEDGTETKLFAAINSKEYKLLFGMLEEAILLLQLGKLAEAKDRIQTVSDKLSEYRTARTGAQPISQQEQLDPALDEILMHCGGLVGTLKHSGFEKCAALREEEVKKLTGRIRTERNAKTPYLAEMFKGEATELLNVLRQDVEAMHKVQSLLGEAMQDSQAMLANGHVHRPKRIQDKIQKYDRGPKSADNVVAALEIRDYARERLKESLAEDLDRAAVKPADLKKTHDGLAARYLKLATELKKLPAEVKSEIDLMILASGQLLDSNSVDALKQADRYLRSIDIFIKNIEGYPTVYADFQKRIDKIETEIKKIGVDYGAYEIGMRAEMDDDCKQLKTSYMTLNQKQVLDRIVALETDVANFRRLCSELRGKKRVAFKMADALNETLDKIGKTLKSSFSNGFITFDGYYGSLRGEVATARADVEKRTESLIEKGTETLITLKTKIDKTRTDLEKMRTDKAKLDPATSLALNAFLIDARGAQAEHDADESKKKDFQAARSEVKAEITEAKKKFAKIKSDPSDLDALETERLNLIKEIEASGAYVDGLKRMTALFPRVRKLAATADDAAEILDGTLEEAAKSCVSKVEILRAHVRGFFDGVIRRAAETTNGNQFDDKSTGYDEAKIKAFLASIVSALPQKAIDDLPSAAALVVKPGLGLAERRDARKAALAHTRALMAVLDGFSPLNHLRVNPFESTAANHLNAARAALPRLEMRLLTAIKE
ncbi:hypothetical protein [Paragemmobacter straminiformis]|uniref:Uncharacterized protein n=1 Tax=Paragemmobacter straminiformis TaxID=2045119 RepID=A0A842IBP7_9RHOB|nr:hypothetical protein [Gemmobacter straminiformis]MBC2836524.1 hypothetical protein [Gemmobacter straminiformis]